MKYHSLLAALCIGAAASLLPMQVFGADRLKDVVGKHFLFGVAVNAAQAAGMDTAAARVITENFNAVVAENCMKGEVIHPFENQYDFTQSDQFMNFAERNHLTVTGHTLVWHSQQPDWMFVDKEGKTVSRDTLIARMHRHIATVVGRYKGKILGWDVVNEVLNDDGTLRQSQWLKIIGPEFIELAFRFAHEADPNAELYINDYSLSNPAKRDGMCRVVRDLKAKGCRVDAIGMQSHLGLDFPSFTDYEESINAFAACGVKVMVTELDVDVLPRPKHFSGADVNQNFKFASQLNPYMAGLPKKVNKQFEQRYLDLFEIYKRHSDVIERVTLWGVTDGYSWLNNFPVRGRTNYPLLFSRDYKAKPVVNKIIKMFE